MVKRFVYIVNTAQNERNKMLIIGETYNQRKAFMWSFIHSCQEFIKALQTVKGENRREALLLIKQEREIIKQEYADLKELQRWFNKTDISENEPYQTPGYKAWFASLTPEQLEEEMIKAEKRNDLILAIKERNGWE